jgi:hypothetical protein
MKNYSLYFRNKYWGFKKVYTGGYTYIGGHKRKDRNYWANWEMRMIPIRSDIRNISFPQTDPLFYFGVFLAVSAIASIIGVSIFCIYVMLTLGD